METVNVSRSWLRLRFRRPDAVELRAYKLPACRVMPPSIIKVLPVQ
jgi:hypothetical protein